MLEIHEVELPFLDRMILFVICIRVDQDLTLLTLHPGEPLLVIQHQDAMLMRRLKEFVLAMLLHLHRCFTLVHPLASSVIDSPV
jgi:hypothetical protein